MQLSYLPLDALQILRQQLNDKPIEGAALLADCFRLNTLYMVMQAGSGHLGSSFSSMDIFTWLWAYQMENPNQLGQSGDRFFSSKGHDAPGLYSVMLGLGVLPPEKLHQLRRLNGLPGHPDVKTTPNILTNTGSLGMGIAKARGMAMARRLSHETGRIYVLCGDGELQEGQFWESLQPTANQGYGEITVIVDHNKIQSDTWVERVSDLGELQRRIEAHGWAVARCNGNDMAALQHGLEQLNQAANGRPQLLICDTLKGAGVSIMEPDNAMRLQDGAPAHFLPMYDYHSGAPSVPDYETARDELLGRIRERCQQLGIDAPPVAQEPRYDRPTMPENVQKQVSAYGDALLELGKKHKDMIVLDGDLMLDCGLIPFQQAFPERFVECGIAEMDMVSMAGGLALNGKLPLVHSFACFLSTRANEQIFNNASEKTKVIYAGSLTGVLPSGPGHSHQSTREISALGSIPHLVLVSPADNTETAKALQWAVEDNTESTWLRLETVPVAIPYQLPESYTLIPGRGVVLNDVQDQADVVVMGYGPILLSEAWHAAQQLNESGLRVKLVNMPWLNRVDPNWLADVLKSAQLLVTLDNHQPLLGQSAVIAQHVLQNPALTGIRLLSLGVEGIPVCGWNHEALQHHGLDRDSLTNRIRMVAQSLDASMLATH